MKSPLLVPSGPSYFIHCLFRLSMSKREASSALLATSPRLSTVPGTSLRDYPSRKGGEPSGEVISSSKVCASSPTVDPDYDISVGLPGLLGFPKEFQEALESVGGCSLSLATKLLHSHDTDGGDFIAGKLCATEEQRNYYSKVLDAKPLSANNNKSL